MSALALWFVATAAVSVGPTMAPVPVLAHAVARGDIVSAGDFEQQLRGAAMANGALAPTDANGREAVRALPAGAVVRPADLVAPRLVRRGEPVTIALRTGNLVITSAGRALTAGGMGDMVRVVAASTNRTLDAVVDGSSTVRLIAP